MPVYQSIFSHNWRSNFLSVFLAGFLPEAWDNYFVKYLYPLFTPTVFLFVAGTVAYGVLKYLQNEAINNKKQT